MGNYLETVAFLGFSNKLDSLKTMLEKETGSLVQYNFYNSFMIKVGSPRNLAEWIFIFTSINHTMFGSAIKFS